MEGLDRLDRLDRLVHILPYKEISEGCMDNLPSVSFPFEMILNDRVVKGVFHRKWRCN